MFTAPAIGEPYASLLALTATDPRGSAQAANQAPATPEGDYTRGCAFLAWERFAEARPCLERALDGLADPLLRLHARRALALAALLTDRPTAAGPWLGLLDEYRAAGAADEAALTAVFLARVYYNRRDMAPLGALIDEWLPRTSPDTPARGHFLRLRGAASTVAGNYAAARALLDEAAACFQRAGAPIEAAHCAIDHAWSSMLQGDFGGVHQRLLAADAVFRQHDLPLRQAICAHNISIEQLQQGEVAAALYQSRRARELFERTGRMLDVGSCDMQLGRIYGLIGDWTGAAAQLTRAREIFAAFGADGRLSSCSYNLAATAIDGGRHDEATAWLAQTEREATAWPNPEILQALPLLRAILARQRDDRPAARAILLAAAEAARGRYPVVWARCAIELGWLDLADGAQAAPAGSGEASEWFAAALPLLEQHPIYQWRAIYGLARCAQIAGDTGGALAHYAQATALVARLRHQLANEHLSSLLFTQIAELVQDALVCAVAAGDAALVLRLAEQQRALTLQRLANRPLPGVPNPDHARLETAISAILAELDGQPHDPALAASLDATLRDYAEAIWLNRHRIPSEPAAGARAADLDLAAIRARCAALHGDDWTIVSYTLIDDYLITSVLTPDAVAASAAPWEPANAELIAQLGDDRSQRRIFHDIEFELGLAAEPWAPLRRLSALLLPEAVRERLGPDHRLYLVPSGALHGVPWATLRVGERWLCELAIIQILPYVGAVGAPGGRVGGGAGLPAALLLGCSDFGERAEALDHVPAELEELRRLWPGASERWLDGEWTLAAIAAAAERGQFADYGIIHIASHAYMHTRHGLAGHILVHDGRWWLHRITELRIAGAFVFMSTCDGAVVAALPGDEQLSLTWSWLAAGAAGVVASLWPVYDGGTLPLLRRFYAAYAAGADAALALALAQRADLADGERSPIEWGCFVMVGGPPVRAG